MSTTDPDLISDVQPLPSFLHAVEDAKNRENARAEVAMGLLPDVQVLVDRHRHTPEALKARYRKSVEETREAMVELMRDPEDGHGRLKEYQALIVQAEYMQVKQRATAARHSGRIRRQYHAAGRRSAHTTTRGYLDSRVIGVVRRLMLAGKNGIA